MLPQSPFPFSNGSSAAPFPQSSMPLQSQDASATYTEFFNCFSFANCDAMSASVSSQGMPLAPSFDLTAAVYNWHLLQNPYLPSSYPLDLSMAYYPQVIAQPFFPWDNGVPFTQTSSLPFDINSVESVPLYSVCESQPSDVSTIPCDSVKDVSTPVELLTKDYQHALLKIEYTCSNCLKPENQIAIFEGIHSDLESFIQRCESLLLDASEADRDEITILKDRISSADRELNLYFAIASMAKDKGNKIKLLVNRTLFSSAEDYLLKYLGDIASLQQHPEQIEPREITKKIHALAQLMTVLAITKSAYSDDEQSVSELVNRQNSSGDLQNDRQQKAECIASINKRLTEVDLAFKEVITYAYDHIFNHNPLPIDHEFTVRQFALQEQLAIGSTSDAPVDKNGLNEALRKGIFLCRKSRTDLLFKENNSDCDEALSIFPYRTMIAGSYIDIHFAQQESLFYLTAVAKIIIPIKKRYYEAKAKEISKAESKSRSSGLTPKFIALKSELNPEILMNHLRTLFQSLENANIAIEQQISQRDPQYSRQLCDCIQHLVIEAEYLIGCISFIKEVDKKGYLSSNQNELTDIQYKTLKAQTNLLSYLDAYSVSEVLYSLQVDGHDMHTEITTYTQSILEKNVSVSLQEKTKKLHEIEASFHKRSAQSSRQNIPRLSQQDAAQTSKPDKVFKSLMKDLEKEAEKVKRDFAKEVKKQYQQARQLSKLSSFNVVSNADESPSHDQLELKSDLSALPAAKAPTQLEVANQHFQKREYSLALTRFLELTTDESVSKETQYHAWLGSFYCYYTPAIVALRRNHLDSADASLRNAEIQLHKISELLKTDPMPEVESIVNELLEDLQSLKTTTIAKIEKHAKKVLMDFENSLRSRDEYRAQNNANGTDMQRSDMLSQTPQAIEYRLARERLANEMNQVTKQMTQVHLLQRDKSDTTSSVSSSSVSAEQLYQSGYGRLAKKSYQEQLSISKKIYGMTFKSA